MLLQDENKEEEEERQRTLRISTKGPRLLTDSSHAPRGEVGVLDAAAPPVCRQHRLAVAEGAVGVAAG